MSFEAFIPPSVENPDLILDKNKKEPIEIERKYTQNENSSYKTIKKIETKDGRKTIFLESEDEYEDNNADASFVIEKKVIEEDDDLNIGNEIKEAERIIEESEEESLQSALTNSDYSNLDVADQIEDAEKNIDKLSGLSLGSINLGKYALDIEIDSGDYTLPDYSLSYDLNNSNVNLNSPKDKNEIEQNIIPSRDNNNYNLEKLISKTSSEIALEISEKFPDFKDKIKKVSEFVTSNEEIMQRIFGKERLSSSSIYEHSEVEEIQRMLANKAYEEILKQASKGAEYSKIKEAFENPTIENIAPLIASAINEKSITFGFKTEDANLKLGIGKDNVSFAFEMNFNNQSKSIQKEQEKIEKLRGLDETRRQQAEEEIAKIISGDSL